MATDYASELLGSSAKVAPPATDYASDILGTPSGETRGGAVTANTSLKRQAPGQRIKEDKGLTLADVELANRDAGVTDKTTADFTTMTKAAMVDDPQTKLKIYAKARFPDLPEAEALSRYGLVDGEPIYLGKDDKIYREHPAGFTGWLKGVAANTTATAPATVLSTVGAVAGAPAGPGTAVAGAVAGATTGEAIRKGVANLAFDEPQTAAGNAISIVKEGAFAGGGTVAGNMLGKFLTKGAARDIAKLDKNASADLTRKADAIGVDLDPAQTTNLPSLKAKKDVLASMPTSRDIIYDASKKQAGQAASAVDRFLNSVSTKEGLDEAGDAARNASGKVIKMLAQERADEAAPLYKAAFEKVDFIPPDSTWKLAVTDLMERPAMKRAFNRAVKIAAERGETIGNPTESLRGLHYMKLAIDDELSRAGTGSMGNVTKAGVIDTKQQLLAAMDGMSEEYRAARKIFADLSPGVNAIKEGVVSKVADLSDEGTHRAAEMLFGGNVSARTVERSRELFERAGLSDDWKTLTRAYLQKTFENAGKQSMSAGSEMLNQAPKWRAAMVGDVSQMRVLRAAMDRPTFAAFSDMMDVFEAMGRTAGAGQGSATMTRQEGAKLIREEAGSGVLGQAASLASPQNIGSRVKDWLAEARLGKHAEKMATIMTSPDGMKRLRDLKQLSPNDQKFIAGVSSLFGISLTPHAPGGNFAPDTGQQ